MAFSYDNVYILQQGGRWGILTHKTNACSFASIPNLGLVSPGWIISHHYITLTNLLPSLSNGSMLWKPQTKFILVTMDQSPHTNMAILSIMMSLQIRLIISSKCNFNYDSDSFRFLWDSWRFSKSLTSSQNSCGPLGEITVNSGSHYFVEWNETVPLH